MSSILVVLATFFFFEASYVFLFRGDYCSIYVWVGHCMPAHESTHQDYKIPTPIRPTSTLFKNRKPIWPKAGAVVCRIFFIFIFKKKLKFQKYMAVSKNFKTIPLSPRQWATGDLSPPGWATGPKRKKNYI